MVLSDGNPAVIRDVAPSQAVWDQYFPNTNLCPLGEILRIEDPFMNLDDRYISGTDISLYFDLKLNGEILHSDTRYHLRRFL